MQWRRGGCLHNWGVGNHGFESGLAQRSRHGSDDFDDLTALLGTIAGLAGFVSNFIISSTFAFSVLQRTREIALLRLIGATRRQILRMISWEATIIVLAGIAVGLVIAAIPLVATTTLHGQVV